MKQVSLLLWVLSMVLLWVVGIGGLYSLNGFPDGITETATRVLQSQIH